MGRILLEELTKEELIKAISTSLSTILNDGALLTPHATQEADSKKDDEDQEIYTFEEAANYLRMNPRTLSTKLKEGKVTYSKDGSIKIKKENLDKYIDRYEQPSKK